MVSRAFRLQGLLNLRQLQEDQAAGRLAAANADLHNVDASLQASRTRLGKCELGNVSSGESLGLAVAIRDGARQKIADNQAKRELAEGVVERAQLAWSGARRKSASLEKLQDRHKLEVFADELHKEQVALDELSSSRGNLGATEGANRNTPGGSTRSSAQAASLNSGQAAATFTAAHRVANAHIAPGNTGGQS